MVTKIQQKPEAVTIPKSVRHHLYQPGICLDKTRTISVIPVRLAAYYQYAQYNTGDAKEHLSGIGQVCD